MAASIGLTIAVARLLPVSEAGAFFYLLSICLFGSMVGRFGLELVALRYIAENRDNEPSDAWLVFQRTFQLVTIQATLIAPVLAILLAISNFEYTATTLISALVLSVALSQMMYFGDAIRGYNDVPASVALGGLLFYPLSLVATLVLATAGGNQITLTNIVFVLAVIGTINSVAGYFYTRAHHHSVPPSNPARFNIRHLYTISLPIGAASTLGFLLINGDLWMLAHFADETDVGIYGAALRLTFIIGFPLQIVNIVTSPHMAKLHRRGATDELAVILQGSTFVVAMLTIPAFIALSFYGSEVLSLVFGSAYAAGAPILSVLLFGWLVKAVTGPCSYLLYMSGHQRFAFIAAAASFVVCVPFAYMLLGIFGPIGVAIGFTSGTLLLQICLLIGAVKFTGVNTIASPRRFMQLARHWQAER